MPTTTPTPILAAGSTPTAVSVAAVTSAVANGAVVTKNVGAGTISVDFTAGGSGDRYADLTAAVSPPARRFAVRYRLDAYAADSGATALKAGFKLARTDGTMVLAVELDLKNLTLDTVTIFPGADGTHTDGPVSISAALSSSLGAGSELACSYNGGVFVFYIRKTGESADKIYYRYSVPDAVRADLFANPSAWRLQANGALIGGASGSWTISNWKYGTEDVEVTRDFPNMTFANTPYRKLLSPQLPIALGSISAASGTTTYTGAGAGSHVDAGGAKTITLGAGGDASMLWKSAASAASICPSFGVKIDSISNLTGGMFLEIGMYKDGANFAAVAVNLTAKNVIGIGALSGTFGTVAPTGLNSLRGNALDFSAYLPGTWAGAKLFYTLTNAGWVTLWLQRPGETLSQAREMRSFQLPHADYDADKNASSQLFDAALRDPTELALWKFYVKVTKQGGSSSTIALSDATHSAAFANGARDQNWCLVKDAANPARNNQVYVTQEDDGEHYAWTSGELTLSNDVVRTDTEAEQLYAIRSIMPAMFRVPLSGPNGLWAAWADTTRQTTINWEPVSLQQFLRPEKQGTGATLRLFPDNDGCFIWDNDAQKWVTFSITFGDYVNGRSRCRIVETTSDMTVPGVYTLAGGVVKLASNEYDVIVNYDTVFSEWIAVSSVTNTLPPDAFDSHPVIATSPASAGTWTSQITAAPFANPMEGTKMTIANGTRYFHATYYGGSGETPYWLLNNDLTLNKQLNIGHYRSTEAYPLRPHAPVAALPGPGLTKTIYAAVGYNYAETKRYDGTRTAFANSEDTGAVYLSDHIQPLSEFDYQVFGGDVDTTAPTLAAASINASGNLLTATFAETDNPPLLPATAAAGVTLTGGHSLGAGTRVGSSGGGATQFTFPISPVVLGSETVTAGYGPSSGNITDSAATPNEAATVSGIAVANGSTVPVDIADTTLPTLSALTIPTAGNILTATLSESGCLPTSGTGGFTLTGTAGSRTVTSWAISGTTLTLTISGVVYSPVTDTPILTYNRATTTNDIADAAGNFLANFTAQAVTNNSTQSAPGTGGDVDLTEVLTAIAELKQLVLKTMAKVGTEGGTQVINGSVTTQTTTAPDGSVLIVTAQSGGYSTNYIPAEEA